MFYPSKENAGNNNKENDHRFAHPFSVDEARLGQSPADGFSLSPPTFPCCMSASILCHILAWRSSFSFGHLFFLLLPKNVVIVLLVFLSCTPPRLCRFERNTVKCVGLLLEHDSFGTIGTIQDLLFGIEVATILGEASNH